MKRTLALVIITLIPFAAIAQDKDHFQPASIDTANLHQPNTAKTQSSRDKELFPKSKGVEVLDMKADSSYSNGLNPKEANEIAKPKKKKGVKISSKDCPVT